jgi:uncharacterized protein (UPF0332 family)
LLTRGIEPKTHGGALHLFNSEIVRGGVLPQSYNRLIAGMQRSRELADYDAAVLFSADDARALCADAQSFGRDVEAALEREGYLASGSSPS